MGRLLRLGIFLLTRLGLFVTVTAWLVSQFWQISVQKPVAGDLIQIRISKDGWSLLKGQTRLNREVELNASISDAQQSPPSWRFGDALIGPDGKTELPTWFDSKEVFPGVIFSELTWSAAQSIAVRHWLPLAIFSVGYLILKLVYRKKPGPEVDEELE